MFTREDFLNGLKKLFPKYVISDDLNKISYYEMANDWDEDDPEIVRYKQVGFEFTLNTLDELIDNIPENSYLENNILFSSNYIEAAITEQGHSSFMTLRMRMRRIKDELKVEQHDCRIEIESASQLYIIALICSLSTLDKIDRRLRIHLQNLDDIYDFEKFCNHIGMFTVKMYSAKKITFQQANSMLQSYLFNIAYKNDLALSLIGEFDTERSLRRRIRRDGQLFPYKSYKTELLKYYNQGISTNIYFAQYLAFYHVCEFFFQSVSEEDLFQEIQYYLTRPSFSPYSKSEIKNLYKKIRRKYLIQKDNDVWDERTALMLCLKKFIVDINSLKTTILSIDPNAVDYYSNNEALFADEGVRIDFESPLEDIYAAIQKRVYSVRNAIVHSKEGDKRRYEPFKHDTDLAKEIPLIRAVAEEVIINSGTPIKID